MLATAPATVSPSRRHSFVDLARAVLPGLYGQLGVPAVTVPPALLAAASWTGADLQPITGVPVSRLPAPTGFRRTLVDLLPEIPVAGGGLSVPSLVTAGAPAPPHTAGTAKVETALTFGGAVVRLEGTATIIRITEELLDDATGLGAWLDVYLGWLVKVGEEDRILNGVNGFMAHPDIPAYAGAGGDLLDKLTEAAGAVASASGLAADTYVVESDGLDDDARERIGAPRRDRRHDQRRRRRPDRGDGRRRRARWRRPGRGRPRSTG